jgi:hypothetical protein
MPNLHLPVMLNIVALDLKLTGLWERRASALDEQGHGFLKIQKGVHGVHVINITSILGLRLGLSVSQCTSPMPRMASWEPSRRTANASRLYPWG